MTYPLQSKKVNFLAGLFVALLLVFPPCAFSTLGDDPLLPFSYGIYDQYNTSDSACFDKFVALCGADGLAGCSLIALPEAGVCHSSADQILDRTLFFFPHCPHRGPPETSLNLPKSM